MNDQILLQDYVENNSEKAFAELTRRHLPLVYATALRLARDPHTADEVTQSVFIQLARKACTVREGQALSGWLYRATQRAYFMQYRREYRRRLRETEALNLADLDGSVTPGSEQLTPLLDQALGRLSRLEQHAIVLRFIQGRAYREVGSILGLSERAAHQRVARSVEKMRRHFSRRGVTTTAALLATALNAHAVSSVPPDLASRVLAASLSSATAGGGLFHVLGRAIRALAAQRGLATGAAAMAVAATLPLALQYREINHLRQQMNTVAVAASSAVQPSAAPDDGSALARLAAAPSPLPPGNPSADTLPTAKNLFDLKMEVDLPHSFRWAVSLSYDAAREKKLARLMMQWTGHYSATAISFVQAVEHGADARMFYLARVRRAAGLP